MKVYLSREAFRQAVGLVPPADASGMQLCSPDGHIWTEFVFVDGGYKAPTVGDILDCAELEKMWKMEDTRCLPQETKQR